MIVAGSYSGICLITSSGPHGAHCSQCQWCFGEIWAVSFPCYCLGYQSDQKHPIMEPRELVETSAPFLGSGGSIPPLGADTDRSRRFWECGLKFPKATSCCSPCLLSRLSPEQFHPPSCLRKVLNWNAAALPRSSLVPPGNPVPQSAACGDTDVTKARCPGGDTPSPVTCFGKRSLHCWDDIWPRCLSFLICSGAPGEFWTLNITVFSAKKDSFQGVFLVFAVEIKAVCDYLIWELIHSLAPASKEVLTAWNFILVAELLGSKGTEPFTIFIILEFYAVFCIFWARPSSQDQDVELDSIPQGKTVQGVKGSQYPELLRHVLDFHPETGEQTEHFS